MDRKKFHIDNESPEARENGHNSTNDWLEKLGINKMSVEDKIYFIKNTDFKKFLDLISVLNGKLANIDKIQRWSGKSCKKVVISSLAGNSSPVYEPPDDVLVRLECIYEKMRKEINTSNYRQSAMLLHHAITFSHLFGNANGRTARKIYYLLTSSENVERHNNVESRPTSLDAVLHALEEISLENILTRNGVGTADNWHQFRVTKKGQSIGLSDHLKYLAARRVLVKNGEFKQQEIIDLSTFNTAESSDFNVEYETLRGEWFDEIMKETVKSISGI